MKHWLKLMALFFMGLTLVAQREVDLNIETEQAKSPQHISVRLNLGALLNTLNGGIGFSLDLPLSKRWSIEGELGPIFYGTLTSFKNESHDGLRTQVSLKYFPNSTGNDNFPYIKLMFKYNRAVSKRYFTTISLDGNFSKEQLLEGNLKTYGPSLQIGNLVLADKQRFFVDYSLGLGLIFWDYPMEIPEPEGFELMGGETFLFGINSSGGFLDFILSFKVGMFLGKL